MTDYVSVYATFATLEQARTIAQQVIEQSLAACVNILPPIQSIYRWGGAVQNDTEYAFIAKTTAQLAGQLREKIVQLHSYEVPCVVVWPIAAGHAPYLDWISQATTPSP